MRASLAYSPDIDAGGRPMRQQQMIVKETGEKSKRQQTNEFKRRLCQ